MKTKSFGSVPALDNAIIEEIKLFQSTVHSIFLVHANKVNMMCSYKEKALVFPFLSVTAEFLLEVE